MESPAGALSSTPPRDSKKAGYSVLLFGPVGTNNSKRPIPNPKAQGSDPLVHRGELQHVAAELGSYEASPHQLAAAHPGQLQSSGGSSPSQELGSSLSQEELGSREPKLCVEGLGRRGSLPRLLPKPHCTGPSWTFLRVVSLLEGGPTSPFRAEPGRVPWAKTRPPGARLLSPNPRPGSRVGPRFLENCLRTPKGFRTHCCTSLGKIERQTDGDAFQLYNGLLGCRGVLDSGGEWTCSPARISRLADEKGGDRIWLPHHVLNLVTALKTARFHSTLSQVEGERNILSILSMSCTCRQINKNADFDFGFEIRVEEEGEKKKFKQKKELMVNAMVLLQCVQVVMLLINYEEYQHLLQDHTLQLATEYFTKGSTHLQCLDIAPVVKINKSYVVLRVFIAVTWRWRASRVESGGTNTQTVEKPEAGFQSASLGSVSCLPAAHFLSVHHGVKLKRRRQGLKEREKEEERVKKEKEETEKK
ncbi:hypothetical protein L3Q82_026753 [Scortum barcoo]|uniref:Uncharacterized protein n=1 Tax=Scortum barcoo TaxID=214431 RepID=A0ACB8WKX5_9TELE|nr:hypothetical protein L3Q82_026753 [Scortum barcoo]